MNAAPRAFAALALAVLAAGCGYSPNSSLDEKYQTIHVEPFKNESREYDFQAPLTNAVTRKFLADGRLRVVGAGQADLVVTGTILNYDLRGITFDKNNDVTQFESFITARVVVTDTRTGDPLWREDQLVGETSFSTGTVGSSSDRLRGNSQAFIDPVRSFQTSEENLAAAEALERLAADIFYRTIEPW
jgi:hypothetical protein